MSNTIMKIGETGFYVSGPVTEADLCELRNQGIKSHLYLCPDSGGDVGILPSGFETCKQVSVWPLEHMAHEAFSMDDFAFSVSASVKLLLILLLLLSLIAFCYIIRVNLINNSHRGLMFACSSLHS
jgi:hypothetical protein